MQHEKSAGALRTIGEVADELGVAAHVLRFWESKFTQIRPQKRRGRRYYRPEDVRIITQIKSLLYGQGYTIRGVQKFFADGRHKILEKQPAIEQQNTQQPKDDRPRDLFGNLIAGEETPLQSIDSSGLGKEELKRLEEVYRGLCATRNKLKEII